MFTRSWLTGLKFVIILPATVNLSKLDLRLFVAQVIISGSESGIAELDY